MNPAKLAGRPGVIPVWSRGARIALGRLAAEADAIAAAATLPIMVARLANAAGETEASRRAPDVEAIAEAAATLAISETSPVHTSGWGLAHAAAASLAAAALGEVDFALAE